MPSLQDARGLASAAATDANVHEDASSDIISLSWIFLVVPCIFLVLAFGWIMYNFSQPSDFPSANGFGHADHDADEDEQGEDEKEQLLDAFNESQSHTSMRSAATDSASGSSWKINSKFSTTSRGGSVYTSYPDSSAPYTHSPKNSISTSPRSKRSSLTAEGKPSRSVGSKAAKALAFNRERLMQDLEDVDPIDREQLQRSSSRASETRKDD